MHIHGSSVDGASGDGILWFNLKVKVNFSDSMYQHRVCGTMTVGLMNSIGKRVALQTSPTPTMAEEGFLQSIRCNTFLRPTLPRCFVDSRLVSVSHEVLQTERKGGK